MDSTSVPQQSRVSQSVQALKAWHQLNVVDIAAAMNVSRATAERRLKIGGYRYDEVRALARYFNVSVEQLETGRIVLPASAVTKGYGWNHLRAGILSAETNDSSPPQTVAA